MVYKLSKWGLTHFHNNRIFVCCRCGKKLELGDLILSRGHYAQKKKLFGVFGKEDTKKVYHKACWDALFFEAPKINKKGEVVFKKK